MKSTDSAKPLIRCACRAFYLATSVIRAKRPGERGSRLFIGRSNAHRNQRHCLSHPMTTRSGYLRGDQDIAAKRSQPAAVVAPVGMCTEYTASH